uniref:Uncharacterized protein n=1 Tax=Anguilla anguilla TaxID=7936 RepID=A0A0E9WJY0_ANGAN
MRVFSETVSTLISSHKLTSLAKCQAAGWERQPRCHCSRDTEEACFSSTQSLEHAGRGGGGRDCCPGVSVNHP